MKEKKQSRGSLATYNDASFTEKPLQVAVG